MKIPQFSIKPNRLLRLKTNARSRLKHRPINAALPPKMSLKVLAILAVLFFSAVTAVGDKPPTETFTPKLLNAKLGEAQAAPQLSPRMENILGTLSAQPFSLSDEIRSFLTVTAAEGISMSELLRASLENEDQIAALHIALFLRSTDAAKRLDAARALQPALIQGVTENNLRAIEAAGIIGAAEAQVTADLVSFTRSENPRLRFRAVSALSRLREPTPQVLRALKSALYDSEKQVAARAARSLGVQQPESTQTAELLEGLRNSDKTLLRLSAAMGYRETPLYPGKVAREERRYTTAPYISLMQSATLPQPIEPSREQRIHAETVYLLLARPLTGGAPAAVKRQLHAMPEGVLISTASTALQSENPGLRLGAAEALSEFRPQNEAAVLALKKAMEDQDTSVKASAMRALQAIAGAGSSAS